MERKIYAFDLDNTLCTGRFRDEECKPICDRIDKVNELYKQGNVILITTARDPMYYTLTLSWLIKYRVMFHGLNCRYKPAADYYIDDKAVNDKDFFNT